MTSNTISIKINKPISEVFEFTTSPDNTPKWIEHIQEERVDSFPIKIGTQYSNTKDGINWTLYICSAFEQDKKFTLCEKEGSYRVEYLYKNINNAATELTYHEWMEGGSALSDPFDAGVLEKLKQVMESA